MLDKKESFAMTGEYCACCGKRFYRGCDAEHYAYKLSVHINSSSSETRMFFCSYACLAGVKAEKKEFAKRWNKVKELSYALKKVELGYGWDKDNIFDFVLRHPTILLKGGNSYDKGLFEKLTHSELQGNQG